MSFHMECKGRHDSATVTNLQSHQVDKDLVRQGDTQNTQGIRRRNVLVVVKQGCKEYPVSGGIIPPVVIVVVVVVVVRGRCCSWSLLFVVVVMFLS